MLGDVGRGGVIPRRVDDFVDGVKEDFRRDLRRDWLTTILRNRSLLLDRNFLGRLRENLLLQRVELVEGERNCRVPLACFDETRANDTLCARALPIDGFLAQSPSMQWTFAMSVIARILFQVDLGWLQ